MLPIAIMLMEPGTDKDYMETLYFQYHNLILKTVRYITQKDDMLEDVANDVYVRLIPKTAMLTNLDKSALVSYIINTTRNATIDALRKQNTRSKYLFFGEEDDMKDYIPDYAKLPEDILLNKERRADIHKAFQMIPEKERFMLQFKYVLNMSDSEIARSYGITQDSVRVYLTRARRKAQLFLTEVAQVEG